MEKVVSCLFVFDQCKFLLHICILALVMFRLLQEKTKYFMVFLLLFLVNNSDGVFLLSMSGNAKFFPAVQTICRFGNFIKIN